MFKKLLSNLPFNPSLIGQVVLYAKKVQREVGLRRFGLSVLVLVIVLQLFAIWSPSQPSVTSSNNDLIRGGFTAKREAVNACQQDIRGYKKILTNFGVTCTDIENATTETLHRPANPAKPVYVTGRLGYGKSNETPSRITGVGTIYIRDLWSWDTRSSGYKALRLTPHNNKSFFILYANGNLASYDMQATTIKAQTQPTAPPICQPKSKTTNCASTCEYDSRISKIDPTCKPCMAAQNHDDILACLEYHISVSNLSQHASDAHSLRVKPGDTLRYTLITTNRSKATLTAYSTSINASDIFDYSNALRLNKATRDNYGVLSWPPVTLPTGSTATNTFDVKVKTPIPNTPTSITDPDHYNLQITAVFGNVVNSTIQSPPAKLFEQTAMTLMNIGAVPGTVTMLLPTLLAGYLFIRAKVTTKELEIIRSDYSNSGGNA